MSIKNVSTIEHNGDEVNGDQELLEPDLVTERYGLEPVLNLNEENHVPLDSSIQYGDRHEIERIYMIDTLHEVLVDGFEVLTEKEFMVVMLRFGFLEVPEHLEDKYCLDQEKPEDLATALSKLNSLMNQAEIAELQKTGGSNISFIISKALRKIKTMDRSEGRERIEALRLLLELITTS